MARLDSVSFNYNLLEQAPIATDPCPHVVIPNFVGPEDLKSTIASFPALPVGGSFPPTAMPLSPLMKNLITELEGPKLRKIVAEKFDLDVADAPTMLTLRGYSREKDGRIHCDSLSKRVTILLFLNTEHEGWNNHAGCLRFLRDPKNLDDYAAEIRPVNGTLVVFPNGPTTWHGYHQYVGPRFSIQLNYMHTNAKARHELMRHRVSAFTKRLSLLAS